MFIRKTEFRLYGNSEMFSEYKTEPMMIIRIVIMGCLFIKKKYLKKMFGYILTQADVTERLAQINHSLAIQARHVLDMNKSERHIRGGLATKQKYLHLQ